MRDPLFGTSKRYLVINGKTVIGEVYVLNPRHIMIEQRPVHGVLVRKGKRGE